MAASDSTKLFKNSGRENTWNGTTSISKRLVAHSNGARTTKVISELGKYPAGERSSCSGGCKNDFPNLLFGSNTVHIWNAMRTLPRDQKTQSDLCKLHCDRTMNRKKSIQRAMDDQKNTRPIPKKSSLCSDCKMCAVLPAHLGKGARCAPPLHPPGL